MTRNHLYALSAIVMLISAMSCQQTETDFIGKYEFNNCLTVQVADDAANAMSAIFSPKQYVTKAKRFYVLSPIQINIFIDQSDKKLKGEGELTYVSGGDNFGLQPGESKSKFNFDLKNMRLQHDTLWFSITNQLAELTGRTFKGFIVIKDHAKYIGLDTEFTGESEYQQSNPSFISKNDEMTIFLSTGTTIGAHDFYTKQVADFKQQMEEQGVKRNSRQVLKNSIEYLEREYLTTDE
ncbi:MAG TPA: hypothetical protein PKJ63_01455 [Cyclobacteriaceae bacterium]|nr:hypothetical protein [Cyclobacteriaceae bacterium]